MILISLIWTSYVVQDDIIGLFVIAYQFDSVSDLECFDMKREHTLCISAPTALKLNP